MSALDQAIKDAVDQYNSDLLFGRHESAGEWVRVYYELMDLKANTTTEKLD